MFFRANFKNSQLHLRSKVLTPPLRDSNKTTIFEPIVFVSMVKFQPILNYQFIVDNLKPNLTNFGRNLSTAIVGTNAAIWTLFFTKELFSKNNCPKFEKLSHQKLQLNFYQNWFAGVSKCPLLTGNKELFEF